MGADVHLLRTELGLSRSEFARFLGVSEPTVVRWESGRGVTEPRGLQALLLKALQDASLMHSPREIARIVRDCSVDHRGALRRLLRQAVPPREPPTPAEPLTRPSLAPG